MRTLKFRKDLYSKTALLKAAYNYTDIVYIHLDADNEYFYVTLSQKEGTEEISKSCIDENEFINEMLAQSVRHEVYLQTKNIRELLLARAMATSVIDEDIEAGSDPMEDRLFSEDNILKDWFSHDDKT